MRITSVRLGFAVLLACTAGLAAPAAAQAEASWTTLQVPGGSGTQAFGINDGGAIVGADTNGAFLLRHGTYTALIPGAATGINDRSEIVGYYEGTSTGPCVNTGPCGFLLRGGTYTTLNVPGSVRTYALGISNRGDVTGYYEDANGYFHGFLLRDGTYTTLDVPGATATYAHGINDSDEIVGQYNTGSREHPELYAFLFRGGTYTTLDVPDGTGAEANGINDRGEIVGDYEGTSTGPCANAGPCGFLLRDGTYTTLNYPGVPPQTLPGGINESGNIAGYYYGGSSGPCPQYDTCGFLLTRGS